MLRRNQQSGTARYNQPSMLKPQSTPGHRDSSDLGYEIWDVGGKEKQSFVTTHLISHIAHPVFLWVLCDLCGPNPGDSNQHSFLPATDYKQLAQGWRRRYQIRLSPSRTNGLAPTATLSVISYPLYDLTISTAFTVFTPSTN